MVVPLLQLPANPACEEGVEWFVAWCSCTFSTCARMYLRTPSLQEMHSTLEPLVSNKQLCALLHALCPGTLVCCCMVLQVRDFITAHGASLQSELQTLAAAAPQLSLQDCQQLEQQANQLGRQLLALEAYMQLNQAGFVKICKKHDKVNGSVVVVMFDVL